MFAIEICQTEIRHVLHSINLNAIVKLIMRLTCCSVSKSGRSLIFAIESRGSFHVIKIDKDNSYYLAILLLAIYLVLLAILSLFSLFYRNEQIITWVSRAYYSPEPNTVAASHLF